MFTALELRLKNNGYQPDIIIDIGACKGEWTQKAMQIFPSAKYFLFEPIYYPELIEFHRPPQFSVFNTILNATETTVDWYEMRNTGDSFRKELSYVFNDIKPTQKPSVPLNNFFDSIYSQNDKCILIKIDTQGTEIPILKGASKFYNIVDFILLEMPLFGQYNADTPSFLEHIQFMESIGFIPFDILEPHYVNGFTMQIDILFINKSHLLNILVQKRLQKPHLQLSDIKKPSSTQKTVAFISNKLTLRGTEVAIYDYAHYNETILGNWSIIITRDIDRIRHEFDVDQQAYDKFLSRFKVCYYYNLPDIDKIVADNEVDYLFIEKAGPKTDGILSTKCKNIIHCVFNSSEPHGEIFTALGQTVNNNFGTNIPVLPYMVQLPNLDNNNNMRNELGIPKDALVFGRYGGRETFDIQFVHQAITETISISKDIYFIFMNTNQFANHPQIKYLPGTADMKIKRQFINTCNALIHARKDGETFGLTCGEFAICGKPVITWGGSRENEHILILKDQAVVYNSYQDIMNILTTFTKDKYDMSNNGYMWYTPENVMGKFKEICLL